MLWKRRRPRYAGQIHEFLTGPIYLDFLPELLVARGVSAYLEIGVHFGHMLARISCDTAIGVDPDFILDRNVTVGKRRTFLHQVTSDAFFAETDIAAEAGRPLDLAFLDGLHQYEFLLRDFRHAEAASHAGGLIAMHDCMPLTAEMTAREPNAARTDPEPFNRMWTGDVWKVVPILAKYRPDLRISLVDCQATGLVCVTGLDPTNRVLFDRYDEIVAEFDVVPNAEAPIAAMYAAHPAVSGREVLAGRLTL